jgi:hypothetical protein
MYKVFNIFLLTLIIFFFFNIYYYYSSSENIESKNFNRNNINSIINNKISDLPVLDNDTDNVIKFNDSFSDMINDNKQRNFWDLLKFK